MFNSWIDKKRHSANEWTFFKTKIFKNKYKSWINYTTKRDLKNTAGVDTSDFAKKTDLTYLKSNVDKLDIDKLKTYQVISAISKVK